MKIFSCQSLRGPLHSPVLSCLHSSAGKTPATLFYNCRFRCLFSTSHATSNIPRKCSILRHLYVPIEDVEKLERYRPGGYHPVVIGDRFHNRYRVIQKLGHGSYSTIWLARDERLNNHVAIKVCMADSNPRELDVLSDISSSRNVSGDSLGKPMVPFILDTFKIQGPNGTHACYVTHPAKMSLSDAKDASYTRLFKLEVVRALAAQLAIAIEYVHSQGFAHGDLHSGNALIQLPTRFDYEQYGQPESEAITRFDGSDLPPCVPSQATFPIWLGEASDELRLSEAKILLSDFGEAFNPPKENKFESHAPLVNRSPETRFESAFLLPRTFGL